MPSEHNRNIVLGIIGVFILVLLGVGVYDFMQIKGPPPAAPLLQAPALASTTSHAADLVAGGPYKVKVTEGITFATVGTTTLTMTLYQPVGAKFPTPFIAYTHGGGFSKGDTDGGTRLANDLVSRGYAFASIGYQLSGDASMPAPIYDDFAGIRYLRAHAAEYNLDPGRVVTMGDSAGSELAVLVGVVADDPSYWGTVGGNTDQSSSVQGIVGISGVWNASDFSELDAKRFTQHEAELGCTDLTGPDCADNIHRYFPEFHVDAADPPTLILQGGINSNDPPDDARDLVAAMKAVGIDATLSTDPKLGDTLQNALNHLDTLHAFLDRVFAK